MLKLNYQIKNTKINWNGSNNNNISINELAIGYLYFDYPMLEYMSFFINASDLEVSYFDFTIYFNFLGHLNYKMDFAKFVSDNQIKDFDSFKLEVEKEVQKIFSNILMNNCFDIVL